MSRRYDCPACGEVGDHQGGDIAECTAPSSECRVSTFWTGGNR